MLPTDIRAHATPMPHRIMSSASGFAFLAALSAQASVLTVENFDGSFQEGPLAAAPATSTLNIAMPPGVFAVSSLAGMPDVTCSTCAVHADSTGLRFDAGNFAAYGTITGSQQSDNGTLYSDFLMLTDDRGAQWPLTDANTASSEVWTLLGTFLLIGVAVAFLARLKLLQSLIVSDG